MDTPTTSEQKRSECCTTSVWHSSRIQSSLSLVLILLAAFLFAETIKVLKEYGYVGTDVYPSKTISVFGSADVYKKPDTAEFTFTVVEEGATVDAVAKAAETKVNDAIAALKEKGVNDTEDVKTIAYELAPKVEWQPAECYAYPCERRQITKGYTLNQSVQVRVRDITKAGEMLDAVTGKGVQQVSGLTFKLADEDAARAEARSSAIAESRAKADDIARALGLTVVRVASFNEDGFGGPMFDSMMMSESSLSARSGGMVAEKAATVPSGTNKITSTVNVVYEVH